jgi:hypothetical protein
MDGELSFYPNEYGKTVFYLIGYLQSIFDVHTIYANEYAYADDNGRNYRSIDSNGYVSLHAKQYADGNDDNT